MTLLIFLVGVGVWVEKKVKRLFKLISNNLVHYYTYLSLQMPATGVIILCLCYEEPKEVATFTSK
jgi:hypothetical protein